MNCTHCECTLNEAGDKGAYFHRLNKLGEKGIWECAPSCEGTNENAFRVAIQAYGIKLNEH